VRRFATTLPAVAAVVALGAAATAASAPGDPTITQDPRIAGEFRVGETLTASATWTDGSPTWNWLRCPGGGLDKCAEIVGQSDATYAATAQDEGNRLRVRLTVSGGAAQVTAVSKPTPRIAAAGPAPRPQPTPTPTPMPTPRPRPTPTPTPTPAPAPAPAPPFDSTGPPATTTPSVAPRLLSPFPVVRIRGRLTASGARVTLLTVRAPKGVRIAVTCSSARCSRHRFAIATSSSLVHLRPFERVLRAGTRLEIRVTRRSFIGKYTLIVMRRGEPPMRRDRCLMPGSRRPVKCPSG
jgi:hypothetical protein